jgi:hypothetical protein
MTAVNLAGQARVCQQKSSRKLIYSPNAGNYGNIPFDYQSLTKVNPRKIDGIDLGGAKLGLG